MLFSQLLICNTFSSITALSSFQRTKFSWEILKISQNQVKWVNFVAQLRTFTSRSIPEVLIRLFFYLLHRKEVIHPHVPVGIPCYDFTPVTGPTLIGPLLKG